MIGFGTSRNENVVVQQDATVEVNFRLRTQVLSLEELVVTGVTDPIAGVKLPFTVSTISQQALAVPTTHSARGLHPGKDRRSHHRSRQRSARLRSVGPVCGPPPASSGATHPCSWWTA
jgi:hypothetical protein